MHTSRTGRHFLGCEHLDSKRPLSQFLRVIVQDIYSRFRGYDQTPRTVCDECDSRSRWLAEVVPRVWRRIRFFPRASSDAVTVAVCGPTEQTRRSLPRPRSRTASLLPCRRRSAFAGALPDDTTPVPDVHHRHHYSAHFGPFEKKHSKPYKKA